MMSNAVPDEVRALARALRDMHEQPRTCAAKAMAACEYIARAANTARPVNEAEAAALARWAGGAEEP